MQDSLPRRRVAGLAVVLTLALGFLLHACGDQPTSPADANGVAAARGGGGGGRVKHHLTLAGTGSTAGGTLVSDRGGLNCTVSVAGTKVSTSGSCAKDFPDGMVVVITATPPSGGSVDWTGCDPELTENPLSCQATMSTDRLIAAAFAPAPNSVTLSLQGGSNGSGTVQSTPSGIDCSITGGSAGSGCSASYANGTSVTLTATASSGSYLKAWSGAGCESSGTGVDGSSGSCTVSMTQNQSVVVSFGAASNVASVGHWSSPMSWPVVAIHAHLLPNGKVLTYGRMGNPPVVWDPANPAGFVTVAEPADLFCAGHSFLPDGRLLVAGGHSGVDNFGTRTSYIFDASSNTWTRTGDMANGRWYPTNTTLANGDVLTISGGDTAGVRNQIPEVWSNGTWRELTTATRYVSYYPMMFLAPDGRVFMAGPEQNSRYLNTNSTGSWGTGPTSNFGLRDYGSAVMYDGGKILMVGGGNTPTATAEVVDLNAGAAATWRLVGSMAVARRQLNATLLADGTVLATGGTNATGFNNAPTDGRVLTAELWDPATEQWRPLSSMSHYRVYHSSALLLPDGRLLSVGSGQPPASGLSDDYTAEIFTPPYLFNPDGTAATRPVITSAPSQLSYGQSFTVQTPDAGTIVRATWIRLGSVTHAFNQNQRMNRLTVSPAGSGAVSITAPSGPNLAPPGHYMLFLINSNGVPSVAKIIRIG